MTEVERLTAELTDLAGRVLPHWKGYIETRIEYATTNWKLTDDDRVEQLTRCLHWVRSYATIDGVMPEWLRGVEPLPGVLFEDE